MVLIILYLTSILLSVLVAFWARQSLKGRSLWPLLPYLFLVFCQEVIARYYFKPNHIPTGLLYNIYITLSTVFFSFLFYRIIGDKKFKTIILILLSAYLIAVFGIHIYLRSPQDYNMPLGLAGGFVITCYATLFLFHYFTIDSTKEQKKWLPAVWISIGIVVFYPVVSIAYALRKEILFHNITIWGLKLYQAMPQLMSIFMYSCFAYAFYLCRRTNQTS